MISLLWTWLVRYGHVLSAGIWLGGYALLALVLIPRLEKSTNDTLLAVTLATVRLLTYAGSATLAFGLLLVSRTRGFARITGGGEWGGIVVSGIVIAIALLGIGDGALRPALKQMAKGRTRRAQRWAWIGFALTILAIGLMTRLIYALS
ncbi:hypothetical protein BH10CHL1_BH10CHL1_15190 [soil metagenome]